MRGGSRRCRSGKFAALPSPTISFSSPAWAGRTVSAAARRRRDRVPGDRAPRRRGASGCALSASTRVPVDPWRSTGMPGRPVPLRAAPARRGAERADRRGVPGHLAARRPCACAQGASFRTWLFTLAHHRVVDLLRRRGRKVSTGAFEGGGEPWEPGAAAVGRIDQHRAGHGGNARGRDRAAQRADRPGPGPGPSPSPSPSRRGRGRAGGRRSEGGSGPAGSAAARRHHCGALAATLRLGDAMVRRVPGWRATLSPAAVATLKQALDGTAP